MKVDEQRERASFFLEIVNLLPSDLDPGEILPGIDTFDPVLVAEPISAIREWLRRFEKFPAFVDFITNNSLTLQNARNQLFVFRQFRSMIEAILDLGAKERGERVESVGRDPDNRRQLIYWGGLRHTGTFSLPCELLSERSDGFENPPKLKVQPGHRINDLQGLDPRRFKRCPIATCRKAFFATRLFTKSGHAECCSAKCGATYRKKRQRGLK
ncbi:MAG: hypothetical protein JNK51_01845 [Blastocatellia bacterium]|nr:hypothetical protein [Chloracidobacterium sp.]MBL8183640.1 hypothetical protein [Blastocatellia bacterium]HRJ89533.1 hypothetical protein [Pyrinomonadaceae bacterium]HRK52189.1 hypothetical protein [Pyrinomonadaceae bacterium]